MATVGVDTATARAQRTLETIYEAVRVQIKREVNAIFDKEKERIIADLEAVRDDVVAKAALRITRYMDVQNMGDRIIITVSKEDK